MTCRGMNEPAQCVAASMLACMSTPHALFVTLAAFGSIVDLLIYELCEICDFREVFA